MTQIRSYIDILSCTHKLVEPMWSEPLVIEEKVDGCLQYGVTISMADGTKKRINLVSEGEEVLGLNEDGKIVPTPVLKTWKNGSTEDWLQLSGDRLGVGKGRSKFSIKCTPNHRFWIPEKKNYVEAKNLVAGNKILMLRSGYSITPVQQSVLLGKILGDGSFIRPSPYSWGIKWGHTEKDADYTYWTNNAMGLLGGSTDTRISGYGSTMIRARTIQSHLIYQRFKNYADENGKKIIPKEVIKDLDPISLAVWYMDDGSLNHHSDQEDRCNFSTNGFSYDEHLLLQAALEHLGIESKISPTRSYFELRINSQAAERLFLLVAPYIIPCMQRKLPERYRGGPGWLPQGGENEFQRTMSPLMIEEIVPWTSETQSKQRFDITTGTHNFFANGILVHNSQWSFSLDENGELLMRSKGKQVHEDSPSSKMFNEGIAAIKERADLLVPGQVWRGEYLQKPKHNTIKYSRIPTGHIAIFDIELSLGEYATVEQRKEMADFIGLETVPVLFQGIWEKELVDLKSFFEIESFLGGSKIEGIVAKCYTQFLHGNPLFAKLVSEAFKESHSTEWKKANPNKGDIIDQLIQNYNVEARWLKAIQHLRDNGELTNSPQDIGKLMKEISVDIEKEEKDTIKEALFKWAYPQISRGVTKGFPDWYKERLLESDSDE